MYGGVFFWRSETFLLFIAKPLYLVICRHLSKPLNNSEALAEEVEAVRKLIESRKFVVVKIVTDPNKKLAVLEGVVSLLSTTGAGSHNADIEVEIRVIEERLRCMESSLTVLVSRRLVVWEVFWGSNVQKHDPTCMTDFQF